MVSWKVIGSIVAVIVALFTINSFIISKDEVKAMDQVVEMKAAKSFNDVQHNMKIMQMQLEQQAWRGEYKWVSNQYEESISLMQAYPDEPYYKEQFEKWKVRKEKLDLELNSKLGVQ